MSLRARRLGCCSEYVSSILYKHKYVVTFPNTALISPGSLYSPNTLQTSLRYRQVRELHGKCILPLTPLLIPLEEETNFCVHAPLGQLLAPKQGHSFTGLGT